MPGNFEFDELDFLLNQTEAQPYNVATDKNEKSAKKQRRLAEKIADIDTLRQQLQELQRTASEVTEIYKREKQQRIDLEIRMTDDSKQIADLKRELEQSLMKIEVQEANQKVKYLPVQAEDLVRLFIQRIVRGTAAGVVTRNERVMIAQLEEFCRLAKIHIPNFESPQKNRSKGKQLQPPDLMFNKPEMCSIAVQTEHVIAHAMPELCSIAVQTEKLSKRDIGIQHKNMTTTRGTTTATLIQLNDVGTSFPEPKSALNAQQILDEILCWQIKPLSPIHDLQIATTMSKGTCTDLCNVHREVDFLPELPAQLKSSLSRPPSRANFDTVKDENAMPTDTSSYCQHIAKDLLSSLPHNQNCLAKLPPQVFEEIWQVMGKMVFVALQSRPTNNESQADFDSWFNALYESSLNQSINVACNSSTSINNTMDANVSCIDVGTGFIKESTPPLSPKIGLELTPIRLKPQPKISREKKSNEKMNNKQTTLVQEQQQPPETAVHFLSNLNAFNKPNCDIFDIELDEEERQLLELMSPNATKLQKTASTIDCEQISLLSPDPSIADSLQLDDLEKYLSVNDIGYATDDSCRTPAAADDWEQSCSQSTGTSSPNSMVSVPDIGFSPISCEGVATTLKINKQQLLPSLFGNVADSENEEEQSMQIGTDGEESISSEPSELVIDAASSQNLSEDENLPYTQEFISQNQTTNNPMSKVLDEPPASANKRKRKTSSSSSQSEPAIKRFTRFQAKQQLLLEAGNQEQTELNVNVELEPICIYASSPLSPIATNSCEESNSEPIEIPLETPLGSHGQGTQTGLIHILIKSIKDQSKKRGRRKKIQQKNIEQLEQFQKNIIEFLEHSTPLERTCARLLNTDDGVNVVIDAIIKAYSKITDNSELVGLLSALQPCKLKGRLLIDRLLKRLEQLMFKTNERPNTELAYKYVRLYLRLIDVQASIAQPLESYVNPARLLLAKILYHYRWDMELLVMEVLNYFPTVLPSREERAYNHDDPLITVIKHTLMVHKYEVSDPNGPQRALITKLRFEYHFQPFEPNRLLVAANLVEKLKAGRVRDLSYAFALFCKSNPAQFVIKDVLEKRLLPLADSFCDLCTVIKTYDERMECVLQSISMIVKQLPLAHSAEISIYIALFQRVLIAVPRSQVQQAAVQAILRTQRFGFGFALEALRSYKPNYPLTCMTRAMMRSFAERRTKHQFSSGPKI